MASGFIANVRKAAPYSPRIAFWLIVRSTKDHPSTITHPRYTTAREAESGHQFARTSAYSGVLFGRGVSSCSSREQDVLSGSGWSKK
jgi:hypothetical protein